MAVDTASLQAADDYDQGSVLEPLSTQKSSSNHEANCDGSGLAGKDNYGELWQ